LVAALGGGLPVELDIQGDRRLLPSLRRELGIENI
jgi:hypothetical protein